MYSRNDLNTWLWLIILTLVCGLVFITFISKRFFNFKHYSRAPVQVCTSLSCVRCSRSVFSTKKLLAKWRSLQKSLQPDPRLHQRIMKGILQQSSSHKMSTNQSPTVFYLEDLPTKIWYSQSDYIKEVAVLKKAIYELTSEFNTISQKFDIGWVANTVPSGGWYLFYLVNQGIRVQTNCQRCPKTIAMVEKLPLVLSDCVFGNIMFSMLLPGTKISEHCGPTNVRIRCHVPLITPPGYYIKVGGEERTWQEGSILMFDDSFYHEVYHHGNCVEPRVVLMLDLWHPELTFQEKEIVKTLFACQ